MNTEFGGILGGQVNLQSQLSRLRRPAASRKVTKMIDSNTNIVKGAGSPIKGKTDYQQVMKVRQSNVELRRLDNNISSLTDSLNEVTGVSNSFTQARDDLLAIKEIVQDALNGTLGTIEQQEAKQAELDSLITDLDDVANNATISGRKVFNGNFNVTIPTGDDEGVDLDLTFNPDVVYDLEAEEEFQHRVEGFYDGFGNALASNEDYIVVGADNASTFGVNNRDENGIGLTGDEYLEANEFFKDGAIQIIERDTGKAARISIGKLAEKLGYSDEDAQDLFINTQFGSSLSLDGDKLIVGASREDGQGNEVDEIDVQGSAFIIDINEVTFSSGGSGNISSSGIIELSKSHVGSESFFGKDVLIDDGKAYVSTFNGTGSTISVYNSADGSLLDTVESPADSISFGYEMEMTDDKLIVSGYIDDGTNSGTEVGALYVYDKNALNQDPMVIRSPLEAQGYQFGNTVAAEGNIIAVGEHKAGQGANITTSGAVHLFTDNGNFIRSLTPTSTTLDSGDEFGSEIAINENFIAVTAAGDDDKGQDQGAVYIFDRDSGIELAKITADGTNGLGSSLSLEGDQIYIGAANNTYVGTPIGVGSSEFSNVDLTGAGSVFRFDLSGLEVPDIPSGPTTAPTINISTEDLSATNLTDISNGDTSSADAILAQVDGLLAGLDAFEGTVNTASGKLGNKISTLNTEKDIVTEQNALLNKELAEAEEAANQAKFRENPNSFKKKETASLTDSLTTIDDAYKFIDTKMSDSDATKLKAYLNTFVFSKPELAFETLGSVSTSLTSDLLSGIG
ncbi:MAG: hypothetical protein HRT47_01160 [Candidatus Caenarcaniphilales bacterium]|nr:hypothetical protein [Candidatus Caenarcaniphilales bacterium]